MKLFVRFFAIIFLLLISSSHAQDIKTKVLILHSANADSWEAKLITSGIDTALKLSGMQYELISRYLDSKMVPLSDKAMEKLAEFYKISFENLKPDIIIADGDEALLFLLKYRDVAFRVIPIIFCGISENLENKIPKGSGITGVFYDSFLFENIDLIQKLFPDTRNIAFLHDQSDEGIAQAADAEKLMTRFSKISFYFISKLPEERIKRAVATLPPNTVVFMLSYNKSLSGEYYSDEQAAKLITGIAKQPVFSFISSYIGNGVFGGYFVDDFAHGRQAGEMAVEILRGIDPNVYSFQRSPKSRFVFDNNLLIKYGFDKSKLPTGSEVLNLPKKKTYLTAVNFHIISIIVFLILIAGIIFLAFARKR